MFFSVLTRNLNWEILTKNLVTFKRWDGVKDEKYEKPRYRGELPKRRGPWTVCWFKRRGLGEKEGSWYLNAHYDSPPNFPG